MSTTFKKGQAIKVKGEKGSCEFVQRKGGWVTYLNASGTTKKARIAAVSGGSASPSKKAGKAKPATNGSTAKIVKATADLSHYVRGADSTVAGNRTLDCGDSIAAELRGMEIGDVYDAAAKAMNEADLGEGTIKATKTALLKRYGKLNLGMQRMNLGNRIRKATRVLAEG